MKSIRSVVACTLFMLLAGTAAAAGVEDAYRPLQPPQPTVSGERIEVLEIFWYGCPHCYTFEPYLEKWVQSKPEDVAFVRMPAVLNPAWIPHARAYYTAQKLGVLDKIHMPLFHALHRDRKAIFSDDDLRDFFEEQGVAGEDFDRVYHSHEIDTRMKQALITAKNAKITGVPTVIVSGKYVTNGTLAGTYQGMVDAINMLIARERELAAAKN